MKSPPISHTAGHQDAALPFFNKGGPGSFFAAPEKPQPFFQPTIQQKETASPAESIPESPNHTGLPDPLKSGVEQLSGVSLDDVRVHRNSPKPAHLQANAYAQGTDIHVGRGQEKHLAHEAWHVAQQKQGRVRPTRTLKGQSLNDDARLEKEAEHMGAKAGNIGNAVQRSVQDMPGMQPPVVQRDPGDEALLHFFQVQSIRADLGYALMERQTEVALRELNLLEAFLSGDEFNQHPDIMQVGFDVYSSANALRDEVERTHAAVRVDRDTVVGRESGASIRTPHELLAVWTEEAVGQVGRIALAQAKVADILVHMREESVAVARIALGMQEVEVMKRVLVIADELDAALEDGDKTVLDLNSLDSGRTSFKAGASLVTTVLDSLNNTTTGLAFGVVGAVDAGTAFSLSTATGAAMGLAGGILGIFFGAIGTFLGVKNAILGGVKKHKLKQAKPKLSNEEMEAITDFAIAQKNKKMARNIAGTVGGLVAIGAGIIGIVALSAATFGIAAIAAGIAAGLIGLGFVGFKIIRSWWKRRNERREFADEVIAQITSNGEEAGEARTIVREVGMNPDEVDQPKFRNQLAGKVGDYVKSRRTQMAEGLVKALIDGKPSESFDAEIVLIALGLEPATIRANVNAGKVNEAVGNVAGKMASW